jgi:hypothetical protein
MGFDMISGWLMSARGPGHSPLAEWCALKTALFLDSSDLRGKPDNHQTHENFVGRLTTIKLHFCFRYFPQVSTLMEIPTGPMPKTAMITGFFPLAGTPS